MYQAITNQGVLTPDTVTLNRHALVAATPEPFSYDDDGNLLSDGKWNYTWDGENRLIAIQSLSSIPDIAKHRMEYSYDGQGRRIYAKQMTWTGSAYRLADEERYWYDGWNLIGRASLTGLLQTYCWGLDLSGSIQGAGGVGGLLWLTSQSTVNAQPSTYFYGYDGNGNVKNLLSANDGSVAANYEYGPFGELLRGDGMMATLNPFRFSTKFQDAETGLIYYGYRYYNSEIGGWLSRDPMEEDGGNGLYAILDNDAANSFDYLGLKGNGHHIIPWSVFNGAVKEEVQEFFDSDLARIFNDYYKSHGAEALDGISAKAYNKLVSAELEKFLGKTALKDMTLKQAEKFLLLIKNAPPESGIAVYNNAVRRAAAAAMKRGLEKAAEEAAEKSLEKVVAKGAIKGGSKLAKVGKAIPLVGTVVAIYFIYDDSKVYGAGPAIINGGVDAIPLVGTGKVIAELIAGGRFLDVTVGPKNVNPSDSSCPAKD